MTLTFSSIVECNEGDKIHQTIAGVMDLEFTITAILECRHPENRVKYYTCEAEITSVYLHD
jgi:hypothetical protein